MSGLKIERLADLDLLHLELDFGKGNILDVAAIEALRQAIRDAGNDQLRALVIDHAGPHFSFGASVEDHLPERVDDMLPRFHALARETLGLDLPILCAVRGQCLGGGLEVALLADRVIASPDAKFGQPEIQLSVFAPVASALLPHRIGSRRAADLLLSGRTLNAGEALAWGLIDQVAEDPTAESVAWVRQHLAARSRAAVGLAARAARAAWLPQFERTLADLERLYLEDLMSTEDAAEGIRAFLERRPPVWQDR